jgi:hypothetical protein
MKMKGERVVRYEAGQNHELLRKQMTMQGELPDHPA